MQLEVGHLVTSEKHFYRRASGFPLWTLGVCVRGVMEVDFGSRRVRLSPGTVNVVAPDVPYSVYSLPETGTHEEYFALLSMPREWERWFSHWPSSRAGSWTVQTSRACARRVARSFAEALEAANSRRRMGAPLAANLVERGLILANEESPEPGGARGDARLERAMDHAAAHLTEPLTVDELARAARMSASRFAHLFTSVHGMPPMRWVESLRMRRAQSLLLTTEQPIKAIAHDLGYSSPFHFSDRFRACVGQSPTEFRRRPRRG